MSVSNKKLIIIAGPTAVGKTAVAIYIARLFDTEIISADSRQCYKEMDIGVARPSEEELAAVPHHFIASHSILDKVNPAVFEDYAIEKAKDIFNKKNILVMVGGTGLYIKAFCEGLDEIPEVPDEIRVGLMEDYKLHGLQWLQQQTKEYDPAFYAAGEIQNPQRLLRALEVVKATGKSILEFRKGKKKKRDFETVKIALELPKEELHNNINTRVDKMMSKGLLDEVQSLQAYHNLNALQTVGYKELFGYLNNQTNREQAVEDIKKNTRQYAKRQLTWFRKDKDYTWLSPHSKQIAVYLNQVI